MANKIVSIAVANLATTEKYFDHFESEMHSDNSGANRVSVQEIKGAWNSGNARYQQVSVASFTNCTLGNTYWFRFRVIDKAGNPGAWSTFISEVAGDTIAPSPTYGSMVASPTMGGLFLKLNPTSPASDNDHYELFVRLNSSTAPVAADVPTYSTSDGNFSVGLADTDTASIWARAVDTSGNKQAWTSLGSFTSSGLLVAGSALGILSDNLVKNGDFTQGAFNWDISRVGGTGNFLSGQTGLPRGGNKFTSATTLWLLSNERIPVDPNKVYLIECWFKIGSPAAAVFYAGFREFDSAGVELTAHQPAGATFGYCLFSGISSTTGNTWQYFSAEVTGSGSNPNANTFNSSAKYISAVILFNNSGGTVLGEVVGFKISEVAAGHARAIAAIGSDHIVVSSAVDLARNYVNQNLDFVPNGTRAAWDSTTQKTAAVDTAGNLLLKNVNVATGVTSSPTTSSTTYSVIPEMTFTITTKGSKILVLFSGTFQYNSTTTQARIAVFRDGVLASQEIMWVPATTTGTVSAISFVDNPAAGSHTYDVRWKADGFSVLTASGNFRAVEVVELG